MRKVITSPVSFLVLGARSGALRAALAATVERGTAGMSMQEFGDALAAQLTIADGAPYAHTHSNTDASMQRAALVVIA